VYDAVILSHYIPNNAAKMRTVAMARPGLLCVGYNASDVLLSVVIALISVAIKCLADATG